MPRPERIVVVGGGLAGATAAVALRENDYAGTLTVLAGEDELPYERPPLSKGYLKGDDEFADAIVQPREWYAEQNVDLRLGTHATAIDAEAQTVRLSDGDELPYDRLLLATGSTPKSLGVPGEDAGGVLTLRTHTDSDLLRETFGDGKKLAIVGAGWIGLEAAAAARDAGTEVVVVETADLPLLAVLGAELAEVFAKLHQQHGVEFHFGAQVSEITVDGDAATGLRLADGTHVEADAVLVAIGAAPDTALAETAGLTIENGVHVDAGLRSSDDYVWAIGDIANQHHPVLDERIRVEHWANALNQPKVAAKAMLGGDDHYDELPYFYTDQYDLGMEFIGYVPRTVESHVVVRGDLDAREFVAFWLDDDNRLLAAMNVNVWDVVDEIKPLVAARAVVDPAKLTDDGYAYADLSADG